MTAVRCCRSCGAVLLWINGALACGRRDCELHGVGQ